MWRWSLSTVRTFGGHDNGPSLFCVLNPSVVRPARPRFSCVAPGVVVHIANKAQGLDNPRIASSSAEFCPTDPRYASRPSSASSSSILNHHDHRPNTPVWTSDTAINTLGQFLSPNNATSDHPLIYSSTIIRSLYYSAESRNQLEMLDSKRLTLLIGLFGSMSVDIQPFPLFTVPLASRFSAASTHRTHWAFVLKVGKYKSQRGMSLHDSDRFWLMRAELAIVQASSPSEPLSGDAYDAIVRARTHYHAIRRHTRHPEVHAHYLETLMAISEPRLLDLASRDISFLLRTHNACHTRLQRLLFHLITQHGRHLSTRSQENILAALWGRIHRGVDETTDHSSERDLLDISLQDCNSDATTIARSVSVMLFGSPPHPSRDRLAVTQALLSAFCPKHALPSRWTSLILLSVFNSSETMRFDGTYWTRERVVSQVSSCWQIIFGLATVEKLLRESPASEMLAKEEVSETTHTLYHQWMSVMRSSLISPDLAYAVATSFLKITNVLADATLFYGCQDLYRMKNNSSTMVPESFATQYIAAVVRVQGLLPDVVLEVLTATSPDPKQQRRILASAVKVITPLDASLAYALYTFARAQGMEPDAGIAYTVAMSFARHGALHQAARFLNDSQFSPETRGILLSMIAQSLRENQQTRHPQSTLIAIAHALVTLYRSHIPPDHFRGHLEQLFVVLAQHGRGGQLLPPVLSIFRRLPDFFQPRFFDRYCHALIRHRQIFTVNKLLGIISTVHPKTVSSLRILADRIAVQTRTSRTFQRTPVHSLCPLRLPSWLRCPDVGLPVESLLQGLLKFGRILAAKRAFSRTAATIPSNRRTALGNILINGVALQPTSSNGRRVRKVIALLEDLAGNHGFQPDRVTVNILIKAMIGWRSAFNSPLLRALFDQLVSAGYPAADYSPLHPPFGTRQTQSLGPPSFSKLPPSVSFEKHARPLFKMFIKAFYSCNDVEAARKVVGILKVEEYKYVVAKEARQKARTRGRVKAAQGKGVQPH